MFNTRYIKQKENVHYIYKLVNPINEEPFYIGKTNNIRNRYLNHINSYRKPLTPLHYYIRHLILHGIKPEIYIIMECKYHSDWEMDIITEMQKYYFLYNQVIPVTGLLK